MKAVLVSLGLCVVAIAVSSRAPYDDSQRERRADGPFTAFSVGLTHDLSLHLNETIKFDKVFSNFGNGYNKTTGVFTSPTSGTYQLQYFGLSETAGTMWLDMYKNGVYEVTAYAHNVNDYASTSNNIMLQLMKGDMISIVGHGNSTLYGRSDEIYSTFSGWLLAAN